MEVTRGIVEWADSLLEFRRAQGFSGEKYGLYLKSFVSYCNRVFPESPEVTAEAVNGLLDEESEKGFPGAMPEKATVMRTLGKYILAFGGSAYVLPRERYRSRVRYTPHLLSDEELVALFDEIDKAAAAGPCQQAVEGAYSVLFRLIYTCGLRPQEGRLAMASNVDLSAGTLFIRESKFHSERVVGLSAQMLELLAKYKRRLDRIAPNSTYLFPKRDGQPVGKHGLADYFRDRWLAASGRLRNGPAPRVRAYDLRHRFASAVLQKLETIPMKKTEAREGIRHLPEASVAELLGLPDGRTWKGRRDLALLSFMYDTAARVQETIGTRLANLNLGDRPAVTLTGKGRKTRVVPLMNNTVRILSRHIREFHPQAASDTDAPLFFVIRNGVRKQMTEDNVRKLLNHYGGRLPEHARQGLGSIHPHLLRHSRAMHLYQNGMSLELLSQWLGHSQIETTLVYAHADAEMKRKAIEKATPPDSPLGRHIKPTTMKLNDDDLIRRLYGLR